MNVIRSATKRVSSTCSSAGGRQLSNEDASDLKHHLDTRDGSRGRLSAGRAWETLSHRNQQIPERRRVLRPAMRREAGVLNEHLAGDFTEPPGFSRIAGQLTRVGCTNEQSHGVCDLASLGGHKDRSGTPIDALPKDCTAIGQRLHGADGTRRAHLGGHDSPESS